MNALEWEETAPDVAGGASVASLVARLRAAAAFEDAFRADDTLKFERFLECGANVRSGTRVAGEMSSALGVIAFSVSSVFVRIGVRGISTVISGSAACALDEEDAMFNRLCDGKCKMQSKYYETVHM